MELPGATATPALPKPDPTATVVPPSPTVTATTVPPTATTLAPVLPSATTNAIHPAVAGSPNHLVISNVRDTFFVVSWLTAETTTGQVQLAGDTPYDDDRGANFRGATHYVTVARLGARHTYMFDVISGGKKYDHEGAHWTVTTGLALPSFPSDPIAGKIVDSAGSNVTEAIVFFAIDRQATIASDGVSGPLSTLVTAQDGGTFHVNLREARAMGDPTRYYGYGTEGDSRTTLMISAMGAGGSGMAAVDIGDKRLRASDPEQWLVIQLSVD